MWEAQRVAMGEAQRERHRGRGTEGEAQRVAMGYPGPIQDLPISKMYTGSYPGRVARHPPHAPTLVALQDIL